MDTTMIHKTEVKVQLAKTKLDIFSQRMAIKQWIDNNCKGEVSDVVEDYGINPYDPYVSFMTYSFEDIEDAMAFKMTWG